MWHSDKVVVEIGPGYGWGSISTLMPTNFNKIALFAMLSYYVRKCWQFEDQSKHWSSFENSSTNCNSICNNNNNPKLNMDRNTEIRTSKKRPTAYIQNTRLSKRTFYRSLYWISVFIILGLICVGLHYTFKSDFGQCNLHDVKCNWYGK